ncbi:MAG: 5-oxoprolinase subunit PxpB [Massiliimalia sp.]|jgi:inhibitor of KinA
MREMKLVPSGDCGICVEFGNEISEAVYQKVAAMSALLEQANLEGVIEWIPTYRSLTVCYDPLKTDYEALRFELWNLVDQAEKPKDSKRVVLEIPVCYGGEFGPDLSYVAAHSGLTQEQVIEVHSHPEYLIYMLGFTPGFPYLGGMDKRIATPRLTEPRVRIPGGSVGIAGEQTGLYPIDSPGGWQLIGRTPLRLYDPHREVPILLKASQYIKFRPIGEKEFFKIAHQVEQGTYEIKILPDTHKNPIQALDIGK